MNTRRWTSFAALTILAVTACSDNQPTDLPAQSGVEPAASLASAGSERRTIREDFRDLSLKHPGFTGLFFDDNHKLVISTSGSDVSSSTRDSILQWGEKHFGSVRRGMPVRVKRVPFDYASLYAALQVVIGSVGKNPELHSVHIDETKGKIILGVSNVSGQVRAELAKLRLAPGMVELEQLTGGALESNLTDYHRWLVGGLAIRNGVGDKLCTLGHLVFLRDPIAGGDAIYTDRGYMLTASHCTGSRTSMAMDQFGQPSLSWPIEFEYDEAPVFSGGYCGYNLCSEADVAVVQLGTDVTYNVGAAAVSAPVSYPTPPPYTANRYISNTVLGAGTGESITKVGQTTGETTGTITASCVDFDFFTGITVLCMQRSRYGSDGGDSGSPVFIKSGEPGHSSTPRIAGLHVGRDNSANKYFNPASQINIALGSKYRWF